MNKTTDPVVNVDEAPEIERLMEEHWGGAYLVRKLVSRHRAVVAAGLVALLAILVGAAAEAFDALDLDDPQWQGEARQLLRDFGNRVPEAWREAAEKALDSG